MTKKQFEQLMGKLESIEDLLSRLVGDVDQEVSVEEELLEDETVEDPIFEEIREFVLLHDFIETAHIQQVFGIGYSRACRIMDQLEEEGIITPAEGVSRRRVKKQLN